MYLDTSEDVVTWKIHWAQNSEHSFMVTYLACATGFANPKPFGHTSRREPIKVDLG